MDKRTEKTRRSIINAFLQLRSRKPLEKITVRELAELAEINKATFYLHYRDIYDLSETLERDAVRSILEAIPRPDDIVSDVRSFIRQLGDAFVSNERLIKILFEGSRSASFVSILEEALVEAIRRADPDREIGLESRMAMTYMIYGGYYTYFKYCDAGVKSVLELMEKITGGVGGLLEK